MHLAIQGAAIIAVCLTFQKPPLPAIEQRVFDLVNDERAAQRLKALKPDERLAEAARSHARSMAQGGYFSHVDPVRGNLVERLSRAGIPWRKAAENLFTAQGYEDPAQRTVLGWMNSPGHRRNVLDREVTHAGAGAARAPDGTVYVVQIYVRPRT
jgi:uncharacterized protein YkwD